MAQVILKDIVKKFGKIEVVHGISLDIDDKEFVVLVGPSGCGKSTVLRMVAGLEKITSGTIAIGDRTVNDVAPKERNAAMVFQNYALYPHMNVYNNMSFGLKLSKTPKAEIAQRVNEAATILGLEDLLQRKPHQLSGGQRQRVAMGRAIVRKPAVFLFDEPLSNLDAKLRTQMRKEIKQLHRKVETTAIYVTHDQVEAMTLANRIVVMRDGRIEQVGTPLEIFQHPRNTFVAGFIGSPPMNLIPARIHLNDSGVEMVFGEEGVTLPIPAKRGAAFKDGMEVIMGLRTENIVPLSAESDSPPAWRVPGVVEEVEPLGTETNLHIQMLGVQMIGKCEGHRRVEVGEQLNFELHLDHLHIFDADSEESLFNI
jgi:sn-glycerol 3-phosphate transport system ATP-binding protein